MAWPASQDYNEALQNPQSSFRDPELCQGQVVVNSLGIPQPCSGNFADVYAVECPATQGKWAVKCFTREVPRLHERYAAISRHLRSAHLPFIVDFTFLEQGIRVLGQWYPVLKMQWVEGLTLNEFVRQHADKPAMLKNLLQIWVRMAARLRESGIAHADLQHGNVLLVPGSAANSLAVKLVDYDGMFVPALAGGDSAEVGHACYQHPQRLAERTYSSEVDRLPLLLIATALESLRVGGRKLWEKYDNGDNLLFSAADLRAPVKSSLFYELLKLGDGRAAYLASKTFDALKSRLESAPLLEEVLPELHPLAVPKPAAATVTPKRTEIDTAASQPIAEEQAAAEADAASSIWSFGDESEARSRRRRKRRPLRWVGWVAAVTITALLVAGALFLSESGERGGRAERHAVATAGESGKEEKRQRRAVQSKPAPTNPSDPPIADQQRPIVEVEEPAAKADSPEPPAREGNPPAATEPKPSKKAPEISEAKEDFTPLFNGKDLTGWKPSPNDKAKWEVKDGILIGSGPTGHLFSERGDYENFHLRMEAMINDGGNSGIYFRAAFASGFPKGYEARINSTASDPLRTGSLDGIYRVIEQLHKPDEWFQQEVIAEGGRIVVKVNGKTVVDKRDSRYKKGHFALQRHDPATVVKFGKIEVKLLDSGSSPSLVENGVPSEAKAAAKAYEKSCADARAQLLAGFDSAIEQLPKKKISAAARMKLVQAVQEEKQRFEYSGLIPWSEPMRPYLGRYFSASSAAEGKLGRAYKSLIDAQRRAKNEYKATQLRMELKNILNVRVMAKWKHFVNGKFNHVVVLYSNRRCDVVDGNATWSYDKGVLTFQWPEPRAPGGLGAWVDVLKVSAEGTTYAGTNQTGKTTITGVLVKDN